MLRLPVRITVIYLAMKYYMNNEFLFVSGVVLANASLDTAFHDNSKKKPTKEVIMKLDVEYLKQFFVGLLEADGTITVGFKNQAVLKQTGRVRIVIALKRNEENIAMLNLIARHISGKVTLEHKKTYQYVTWVAQSKKDLLTILDVLKTYPLLTSRKQAQLRFALNILENKYTYSEFLEYRNRKYKNKLEILEKLSKENPPVYFPGWLSGFIEGEGSFSLVFNDRNKLRKSGFYIGQNDELHVLIWIKTYFNGDTKIMQDKPKKGGNFNYYRLNLYNVHTRRAIFQHFKLYPLLGYKAVSYNQFYNHHNTFF